MTTTYIHIDENSKPYQVFHRKGREAWTHPYDKREECPECRMSRLEDVPPAERRSAKPRSAPETTAG